MNVRRSSGRDNFELHDLIRVFSNLESELYTVQLLNSQSYLLVFHSQDRNKGLGHPKESQILTEKDQRIVYFMS